MASWVAMVRIPAQETLFWHWVMASTTALALITMLKPSPTRERLSELSFRRYCSPLTPQLLTHHKPACHRIRRSQRETK
ncbi:hypothetical protein MA16_Dca017614 [Dendrobium catenatum]|uniref:Uncharacterized protein n=1 Tax=Dendrobium catenatum TaxID=906689 RepID=A0A2I0XIV1_9ASPA|nr:hypothetical protein MA16_Dca017614 [Dendrobium catenatum]